MTELFSNTDDTLFSHVLANKDHVLQPYLPDRPSTQYNLRAKRHNKELIVKTQHLTVIETISYGCCIRTFMTSSSDINFFTYFSIIHFYCVLVACDKFLHTNMMMIMSVAKCQSCHFTNESRFAANWHKWSTWQAHETTNFEGQEVKCQGHKGSAELRFGDLAEASFSTPMGRVGFLVFLKFYIYRVGQKKLHTELMAITLSILNGFSKFFNCCKAN